MSAETRMETAQSFVGWKNASGMQFEQTALSAKATALRHSLESVGGQLQKVAAKADGEIGRSLSVVDQQLSGVSQSSLEQATVDEALWAFGDPNAEIAFLAVPPVVAMLGHDRRFQNELSQRIPETIRWTQATMAEINAQIQLLASEIAKIDAQIAELKAKRAAEEAMQVSLRKAKENDLIIKETEGVVQTVEQKLQLGESEDERKLKALEEQKRQLTAQLADHAPGLTDLAESTGVLEQMRDLQIFQRGQLSLAS